MALPLIALSTEEAAIALCRAGFDARVDGGRTILRRGLRVVVLPTTGLLDVDCVRAILRVAGVDYVAFLETLEAPRPVANALASRSAEE